MCGLRVKWEPECDSDSSEASSEDSDWEEDYWLVAVDNSMQTRLRTQPARAANEWDSFKAANNIDSSDEDSTSEDSAEGSDSEGSSSDGGILSRAALHADSESEPDSPAESHDGTADGGGKAPCSLTS